MVVSSIGISPLTGSLPSPNVHSYPKSSTSRCSLNEARTVTSSPARTGNGFNTSISGLNCGSSYTLIAKFAVPRATLLSELANTVTLPT